jgi:hypothetical protein
VKTIKVHASTGKVGSRDSTTFEIEDDATTEEIDEAAREAMFGCLIEWGWEEIQ